MKLGSEGDLKKVRKKVYVFKQCEVKPFFREEVDQHHISVVVGVSAACCDIMPLFISTRKHLDPDINETFSFVVQTIITHLKVMQTLTRRFSG